MNKEIVSIAASVLKISVEDALRNSKEIPNYNLMYFWNPIRGGLSVIINKEGEKLVATSSVNFEKHLKAFLDGKRN